MNISLDSNTPEPPLPQGAIHERRASKFAGFDYLRAIFSIAIVSDHAGLFALASILGMSTLTDILYANFSYIAVPTFFQISLFLFYMKSEKAGLQYFIQKRLPKLISLYLFWITTKIICDLLIKGESDAINMATASVRGLFEVIVSGGNSPFYFFFSLTFITVLAEILILLFKNLKNPPTKIKVSYFLLFSSCALILSFSIISLISNDPAYKEIVLLPTLFNITQWNYNPLNFLPYLFTAIIAIQEYKAGKIQELTPQLKLKLYSLTALFLIFTLLEWTVLETLIHYSRLSLVFGSWLLLYLALLPTHKPAAIVALISNCSLGIYGFHLLFTHILFAGEKNILSPLSQLLPGLNILVNFCLALVGSVALTLLSKRAKWLKNFV